MPKSFLKSSSGFGCKSFLLLVSLWMFQLFFSLSVILAEGLQGPRQALLPHLLLHKEKMNHRSRWVGRSASSTWAQFSRRVGGCNSSWSNSQCPVGTTITIFSRTFFFPEKILLGTPVSKIHKIIKAWFNWGRKPQNITSRMSVLTPPAKQIQEFFEPPFSFSHDMH